MVFREHGHRYCLYSSAQPPLQVTKAAGCTGNLLSQHIPLHHLPGNICLSIAHVQGLFMYMIRHPVQSLFVGTFPMGLATIINMIVFVCVPAWDFWATTLAWTLWWIDAVISVMTCFYLPFVIIHVHESGLSKMTAAWLLPIVSTIVGGRSSSEPSARSTDHHHLLHSLGYGLSARYGGLSDVPPSPYCLSPPTT